MSEMATIILYLLSSFAVITGCKCASHSFDCETNVFQRWSVVAAIDIGDAYSRWAYAPLYDLGKESNLRQWDSALRFSVQDKTHILMDAGVDSRLIAFGTDAETKYTELRPEEQSKFLYLKHFKAQVRDKEVLSPVTTVKDSNGQAVNAQKAFTRSIQFLKDEILNAIDCSDIDLGGKEILWVVPAWNDSEIVKQFMKGAAIRAGIHTENLMIEAEANVASVYGRKILKEEFFGEQDDSTTLRPGTKYIMLDAGASGAYVIANKITDEEKLKQISKVNCHHCGGTKIDETFFNFLGALLGNSVLQNFQRVCKRDHLHMLRQFELEKKPVSHDEAIVVKIRISECLQNIVKELTGQSIENRIAQSEFKNDVWFAKGILYTGAELIKNDIFLSVVQKITNVVKTALDVTKKTDGDTALITSGGFSKSPILQNTIQSVFSEIEIIRVKDPDLSVVKGAAMYGSDPSVITERLSMYTYGFSSVGAFVDGVHDPSKKFFSKGRPRSKDIFLKFLEKGQSVKIGEILYNQVYYPPVGGIGVSIGISSVGSEGDTLKLPYSMYECIQKSPVHVTDAGCVPVNYETVSVDGDLMKAKILITVSYTGSGFLLNATNILNSGSVLSYTDTVQII